MALLKALFNPICLEEKIVDNYGTVKLALTIFCEQTVFSTGSSCSKYISVNFLGVLVAKSVIGTKQIFKENILAVALQEPESKRNNEPLERESIDKSRTVLVSDLPEGTSESDVHIHFQKNRNGGGEVEKVVLLQEKNKALVVFEDPEG